ncbi:hypothetical protein RMSM_02539 [Rhodopirellula maiorica SM1]|uniref:Uncharacterized protein n=1 Tax=Rhodopirellula maiorica SM1 TaxID=1265738 RepID=M5RYN0_9BACT|nr:hypothetical protein [Rhodopirellula maiorica]EMI20507.1 hypothetical protein RMSM_02539 [Rhodopirellula maiorica SM1]
MTAVNPIYGECERADETLRQLRSIYRLIRKFNIDCVSRIDVGNEPSVEFADKDQFLALFGDCDYTQHTSWGSEYFSVVIDDVTFVTIESLHETELTNRDKPEVHCATS